ACGTDCSIMLLFFVTRASALFCSFFLYCSRAPPYLHSFPTRRSSDLTRARGLPDRPPARGLDHRFPPAGPRRRQSREPAHRCLRSEEHTSELQSRRDLVCRLLLEKKKH